MLQTASHPSDQTAPRRRPTLVRNLIALSTLGSALLIPPFQLPLNLVVGDFVLVALVYVGWRTLLSPGPSSRLARQIAPWFYLYVIGFVLGLLTAGFAPWALAGMARNCFPILVFLVIVGLLAKWPSLLRVSVKAFVATGLFVSASVLLSAENRSEGVFNNPNYAAHFMACACLLVPYLALKPVIRYAVYAGLLIGIFRTGSFGAIAILLAAIAAGAWRRCGQAPRAMRALLRSGVVLGVLVSAWVGWSELESAEFDVGSGVSSERFERSSTTRFGLWADGLGIFRDHPLGIGAEGIPHLGDVAVELGVGEIHNDVIDTLVAGGVPAVVGMAGMVGVIWRAAGRGSRMRAALVGLMVTSATRQTWNFRHMWIFLAIALTIELSRRAQTPGKRVPAGA